MKEGATLIMSGFYTDDIPAIQEEAGRNGLTFEGQSEKNRWAAVSFKK